MQEFVTEIGMETISTISILHDREDEAANESLMANVGLGAG
jgi:hypothetical protein